MKKILITISTVLMFLSACATDMNSTTYTAGAPVGKVLEGIVVSARPVTIKENAKLQDNTLGMVGGGLIGGIGGSMLGGGNGRLAATAGGALAGAALGTLTQSQLGKQQGMEYVVRLDPKYVNSAPRQVQEKKVTFGDGSVDDEIKHSISVADTRTDLLSVVQGNDVVFQPGQKVLIIYNNDRPRLAPAGY